MSQADKLKDQWMPVRYKLKTEDRPGKGDQVPIKILHPVPNEPQTRSTIRCYCLQRFGELKRIVTPTQKVPE